MQHLKVRDLMSRDVVTLQENDHLELAGNLMALARVRHLPVTSDGRLVGLVTHRDLLRAQVSALAGLSSDETREVERSVPVRAIMTRSVSTVSPDVPAVEAAAVLRDHQFGCLPVTEDGQLVGIITEADFLDLVIGALDAPLEGDGSQPELPRH